MSRHADEARLAMCGQVGDRYGLSFVDVKDVLRIQPLRKVPSAVNSRWTDNYPSKDLC